MRHEEEFIDTDIARKNNPQNAKKIEERIQTGNYVTFCFLLCISSCPGDRSVRFSGNTHREDVAGGGLPCARNRACP